MRTIVRVLVLLTCTVSDIGAASALPLERTALVVVVRRPGIRAYEQVVEELRSNLRAEVRVIDAPPRNISRATIEYVEQIRPDLVFAIGQSAYDTIRPLKSIPVAYTYVYRNQVPSHAGISARVNGEAVLHLIKKARPNAYRIGLLFGPDSIPTHIDAVRIAKTLNLLVVPLRANSPEQAITILRQSAKHLDALWLATDLSLVSPQVVQYAIGLQFLRNIPVLGASRRYTVLGCFAVLDYPPVELGKQAVKVATTILQRAPLHRKQWFASRQTPPNQTAHAPIRKRLTVNKLAAQRLRVSIASLQTDVEVIE